MNAQQILGFTVSVLASRYDEPKPVPLLHEEMWELCCSEHRQVAIAAPRGHAKSTAITFAYVMAALMFREAHHVLIISSNETIAAEFVNDIKVELQENEILSDLFGPFTFLRESTTELVVILPDKAKFRVIAKGANQRMRGLKWERKRPDLVIGDDLEDDEIVLNQDRREKFRRWFYGAVRPIVKSGGKTRVVGTIVHMDSLLERWMPDIKDKNTIITPLKEYNPKQKGWVSVKYRAHEEGGLDEPDCPILWPEQFPQEELIRIRDDFATHGMLDVYGQEYLNNPIDASTAYFKREDFIPMTKRDYAKRKTYYIGVDLAISEKKRTAYSVFVVGGQDEEGLTHIVDVRRGRWDALEIIDTIFELHDRYDAYFRFEKENIWNSIKSVLDREMIRRNKYVSYDAVAPTKDKLSRNRNFQARLRAHQVRVDVEADWYPVYEEELVHFPKWPTLDQADASGWLGHLVADMVEAETDDELEDELWQEAWDRDADLGASVTTGY